MALPSRTPHLTLWAVAKSIVPSGNLSPGTNVSGRPFSDETMFLALEPHHCDQSPAETGSAAPVASRTAKHSLKGFVTPNADGLERCSFMPLLLEQARRQVVEVLAPYLPLV